MNKYKVWIPVEVEAEDMESAVMQAAHNLDQIDLDEAEVQKDFTPGFGDWAYIDNEEKPLYRILARTPNKEALEKFFKALDDTGED